MSLILLGYLLIGGYLLMRLKPTDSERDGLGLDLAVQVARWKSDFGRDDYPLRAPWRLPAEYWLFAWAPSLIVARCAALVVSCGAVWVTMLYATSLGGPRAGIVAGVIVLCSPQLVGVLVTASYVAPVSLLWVGGLYALHTGHPLIAAYCGVALSLLRATSWGQAIILWTMTSPIAIPLMGAFIWWYHPNVVRAQGWWKLIRREPVGLQNWPQDGWGYAARILVKRYESWVPCVLLAGVLVEVQGPKVEYVLGLLLVSLIGFGVTHFPRTLFRPKWAVGYLPEWLLPVAVALGVALGGT